MDFDIKNILFPKQQQALSILLDKETNFLMYGGSAGPGKSYLGCIWIWLACTACPGTKWFIGRNQLTDARKSVVQTWMKATSEYGLGGWAYSNDTFRFETGSIVNLVDLSFYPKKDPMYERYGSLEYTGGWIEEAGEVEHAAFDTIKTRIGRHLNRKYDITPKLLITCNPKKGWLYKDFYLPAKKGTLEKGYEVLLGTHADNPALDESYIAILDSIKDPQKKARLRDGNWEYDDDPSTLIDYDSILGIFTNNHVMRTGEKYLVADVAMQGSDKMVIGIFDGWVINHTHVTPKNDGKEAVEIINKLKVKYSIPNRSICFDADGVGSYLSGYFPGAFEFKNNATPIDVGGQKQNYENLKTQCYYYLVSQILSSEVYVDGFLSEVNKGELIEELEQVKSRDSDKDGKIKLIKKEEVKRNIGRSPDFSDMLAMRSIFDLKPKKIRRPYKIMTV